MDIGELIVGFAIIYTAIIMLWTFKALNKK
jgi:hypothetical protein